MLWVPMSFTAEERSPEAAGDWNFAMVGRLKQGVSLEQAHADAESVAQADMRRLPADLSTFEFRAVVRPLREVTVRNAKPLLRVLLLAVTVVLLIACANLASLLLVRAVRYQREIAVRLALGASTQRLLRQVLLESTAAEPERAGCWAWARRRRWWLWDAICCRRRCRLSMPWR